MKFLKKLGLVLLLILALLIGAAVAIPNLFKDKINTFAKEQVNNNIDAKVDFREVNLSFFRSFPNLSFRLSDFSVVGKDEFEGVALMEGENFDVAVDLMSVIRGETTVKSIRLTKPNINIYVLEDGKANYDIVSTTDTTSTTSDNSDFKVELQGYSIEDGRIHYDDKTLGLVTTLANINHSGKGNLSSTIFDLETETEIAYTSLNYDGIAYLDSANVKLDAIFNANLEESKYSIAKNDLYVNALHLQADGFVQLVEASDDINLNLSFNAPETEFRELLSLLPNAYTEDFRKVKTDGTFQFNGFARGIYNAVKEQYPAFELNLGVKGGELKYPDLPTPINDINTTTQISNPGGSLDATFVDVQKLSLLVGKDPVEAYLKLRTPISDPNIDTRVKANLDLGNLSKAYPLEGVQEIAGKIVADVTAKARQSDIERENYGNVNVKGSASIQDMLYIANGMPNVNVRDAVANFTPQYVDLVKFDSRLGKSDLYASGKIFNPLAALAPSQTLRGNMRVRSNYFNADEWLTEEGTASSTTESNSDSPKVDQQVADQYNFEVDAEMRKIVYDVYEITDLSTDLNITANDLKLNRFSMKVNGSDLTATGNASNLYNFTTNGGVMVGAFDIAAGTFDLDQLMASYESEESEASSEGETSASAASLPPYRYNLDLNVKANKVAYDPYNLSNLTGKVEVTEQKITIPNFDTRLADGDISGNGTIRNYMEYALQGDTVYGDFNINSNFLNANSILASEEYTSNIGDETPEMAQPEDLEAFIMPRTWNFKFKGDLKEVLYADLKLRNVVGDIIIQNGRLLFENTTGETLGGSIEMTGGYDTQNPDEPKFDMKLALNEIGIPQAFNTFNTFETFAPIGAFLNGKMNTTLLMSSVLGQDMMPDLNTLNLEGFLQTIDASIKNFKPFQAIGNSLQIREINFDEFEIDDTKNWFTIENGSVKLEEAKLRFKDIDMTVSGTSSLDKAMDFNIIAVVPRKYIGSAANKGLNLLESKAQSAGLNLSAGSHIKMRINLTGSMTEPKVGITPLGAENRTSLAGSLEDSATEQIGTVKEEAKEEVNERITSAKEEAKDKVNEAVDSAKAVVQTKIDSVKNEAKTKAQEAVGEKAEELKEKLDKYNPFKKKKKGRGEP
ncbi:MAG: AsmA-like C-terminal region-containing protein [Bacteroidota bacterium]